MTRASRRLLLRSCSLFTVAHLPPSQEVRTRSLGLVAVGAGILAAAWQVFGSSIPGRPERGPRSGDAVKDLRAYATILLTTLAPPNTMPALPAALTLLRFGAGGRTGVLLRWLTAQGLVALLYLPWVIYAAPRLVLYVSQKVVADADRPLGLLAYLARHLAALSPGTSKGRLPLWPCAAAVALAARRRAGAAFRPAGKRSARALLKPFHAPASPDRARARSGPAPAKVLIETLKPRLHPGNGARRLSRSCSPSWGLLLLGWLIGLRYPFFPERGERLLLLALPAFVLLAAAAVASAGALARAGFVTLGLVGAVVGASPVGLLQCPALCGRRLSPAHRTPSGGAARRPRCSPSIPGKWATGGNYTAHLSGGNAPSMILSPQPSGATWWPPA